jgi:hypothetical protein
MWPIQAVCPGRFNIPAIPTLPRLKVVYEGPGKPMKGWAMIAPEGIAQDADLKRHTELAISFAKTLPGK